MGVFPTDGGVREERFAEEGKVVIRSPVVERWRRRRARRVVCWRVGIERS